MHTTRHPAVARAYSACMEAAALFKEWSGYLKPEDITQLESAYQFSEAAHEGPVPQVRRALHLPPARRRRHPRAVAPGSAGADRGAAARRDGRHRGHQDRDPQQLRQAGGRAGRRRLQARPDRVRDPRGSAGRELPQDAARDGARRARHPDQARRPAAQHAHARRCRPEQAPAHRARDDRDLRADRQPAGAEQHLPGARGPFASSTCIPTATACLPKRSRRARQPPRSRGQGRWRRSRRGCSESERRSAGARAREAPLLASTARCARSTCRSRRCSTSSASASS